MVCATSGQEEWCGGKGARRGNGDDEAEDEAEEEEEEEEEEEGCGVVVWTPLKPRACGVAEEGEEYDLERSGADVLWSGLTYPAMLSSSLNSVISGVLCAARCMRMMTPKLNLETNTGICLQYALDCHPAPTVLKSVWKSSLSITNTRYYSIIVWRACSRR